MGGLTDRADRLIHSFNDRSVGSCVGWPDDWKQLVVDPVVEAHDRATGILMFISLCVHTAESTPAFLAKVKNSANTQ